MSTTKLSMKILGGNATIVIEGDTAKDIFKEADLWGSLPDKCPKDGSALTLGYRNTKDDYHYYELVSTGNPTWTLSLGQAKKGNALFYDRKKEWQTRAEAIATQNNPPNTPEEDDLP